MMRSGNCNPVVRRACKIIQDYVVVEGAEDACEVISWAKDASGFGVAGLGEAGFGAAGLGAAGFGAPGLGATGFAGAALVGASVLSLPIPCAS